MASGSIIIVDRDRRAARQPAAARAGAARRDGYGAHGLTSSVGSGDLIVAFSTSHVFERVGRLHGRRRRSSPILDDDDALDALYGATAEATQAAIYDALFESKTMTGRDGVTVYALPVERVLGMLRDAGAIAPVTPSGR